jgi:hypothetical protein
MGLLAVVSVIGLDATPPTASAQDALPPGGTFLDDDRTEAEGSIEAIAARGITNGCDSDHFCPRQPLTRAEASVLVDRALTLEPTTFSGFPDIDGEEWYAEAVTRLAGHGILQGHNDGTFRPSEPLSRAQMAQLLVRALDGVEAVEATSRFIDVPGDAPYASSVEGLATSSVTMGCSRQPARFCPSTDVTRAEMALFLTRALGLEPMTPPDRVAPLNGLVVDGLSWDRRVLAVKIDDHRGGRPQSGVEMADAVVETLVEGGLTRWMALFHQSDTSYLGPVRSVRPTDIGMVLPLGATMIASGGQAWIIDQVAASGVNLLRERDTPSTAMFRITERQAPHNVYVDTAALRRVATEAGFADSPPRPMFVWGDLPEGEPAGEVTLQWSEPIAITWVWDGLRYRRWRQGAPHEWKTSEGTTGVVSADLVVVLKAPLTEAQPPPGSSGSAVPVMTTLGQGEALIFADGQVVEGEWARRAYGEPFSLFTTNGEPLPLPPGIPWINVFPAEREVRY